MTANRFNFRCWDKQNQHMFYDGYNCWEDTHITTHDYLGLSLGGDIYRQWEYVDNAPELANLTEKATNEYILMQSTGLVDKNGKEIYEGDIVRFLNKKGVIKEVCGTLVCYWAKDYISNDTGFYNYMPYFTHNDLKLEVIGNIYEHHYLLSKNEKSFINDKDILGE